MNKFVDMINKWSGKAELSNLIRSDLYKKYNVTESLRFSEVNRGATGLTRIGEVICYSLINGELIPESGRFRYRGVEVNDIVKGYQGDKKFGYEEVCFLLIFGELPTNDELDDFIQLMEEYRKLPFEFIKDITHNGPNPDVMNTMTRGILALYSYDEHADDISMENALKQCLQLIAKIPLIAIYSYQAFLSRDHSKKVVISSPIKGLSLSENLLYMLRGQDSYTHFEVEVLDLALLLLAEHGAGSNASFTTHIVSSSGTDTYSVFAAAFSAMKGPKHGGVIIKVSEMMDVLENKIKKWSHRGDIEEQVALLIGGDVFDEAGALHGFGHVVYTESDPRVVILKEYIKQLAYEKGFADEYNLYVKVALSASEQLMELAVEGDSVVVTIEYYMSLVFKMLGIPKELFTPMFAISRSTGIASHRLEELMNDRGIIRPIYKSVNKSKPYTNINER